MEMAVWRCKQLLVCMLWLAIGGQLITQAWSQMTVASVRLINGASELEGQLEVRFENATEWHPVCEIGDNGNQQEHTASLVCQSLGYSRVGGEVYTVMVQSLPNDAPTIQLSCFESEDTLTIEACGVKQNPCGSMFAGVRCINDVSLILNGETQLNNSLINIEEFPAEDISLVCQTTNHLCCSNPSQGGWFIPGGREVTDAFTGANGLYTTREDDGTVTLNLLAANDTGGVVIPSGVFGCEIPDIDNITRYLYIGIYTNDTGQVDISGLEYNVSTQTLICTSTGGPATSVTWTKDDIVLDITNRNLYEYSQVIIDTANATYENQLRILSVTGSTSGLYGCTVENSISRSSRSGVAVFAEGTTRLQPGEGSRGSIIEVYLNGEWQTICSNLFLEGDSQQLLQNVNIEAENATITATWERVDGETGIETEIKCSTTYEQTFQEHRVVPLGDTNTVTIANLLPLTTYNCCVIAYQDSTNMLVGNMATTCMSVTTMASSMSVTVDMPTVGSMPSITTDCDLTTIPSNTFNIASISLATSTGVLLILLIIALVGIPLAYVSAKRKIKADIRTDIPTGNPYQEVHLRNPIYSSQDNLVSSNEELEYSTVTSPVSRVKLRTSPSLSSDPNKINQVSLQIDNKPDGAVDAAGGELYETVPDKEPVINKDLVMSDEHPKPSYAVLEDHGKDHPRSDRLSASVPAYEVVNLLGPSSGSQNNTQTSQDPTSAANNSEYSTVRDSMTHEEGLKKLSETPPTTRNSWTPADYCVPVDSPRTSRAGIQNSPIHDETMKRLSATLPYKRSNLEKTVPADYCVPVESLGTSRIELPNLTTHDKSMKRLSATPPSKRNMAVPAKHCVSVDSPRTSRLDLNTMKPQVAPYQVTDLALASRHRSVSLQDGLVKKEDSPGLSRSYRSSTPQQ